MFSGIRRVALLNYMRPDVQSSETGMPASWTQSLRHGCVNLRRLLRGAAQTAVDWLTKKWFLATYEASDDAYWRRHVSQCEWRPLGGIIEYCPDLLVVPGQGAAPAYLIAIRATANRVFERVVIKVKAKKSGIIHEQMITFDHLCTMPVRKALSEIPLSAKSSQGVGWYRLGDLYIKLVEAVDRDGVDLTKGKKIAHIFPSIGRDSVSAYPIERWGQYWNTDSIDAAKENLKARYYRRWIQSAKKLGRPLIVRRGAYRILSGRVGLNVAFWSENLWNAKGIRDSISQAETSDKPISGAHSATASVSRNPTRPAVSADAG